MKKEDQDAVKTTELPAEELWLNIALFLKPIEMLLANKALFYNNPIYWRELINRDFPKVTQLTSFSADDKSENLRTLYKLLCISKPIYKEVGNKNQPALYEILRQQFKGIKITPAEQQLVPWFNFFFMLELTMIDRPDSILAFNAGMHFERRFENTYDEKIKGSHQLNTIKWMEKALAAGFKREHRATQLIAASSLIKFFPAGSLALFNHLEKNHLFVTIFERFEKFDHKEIAKQKLKAKGQENKGISRQQLHDIWRQEMQDSTSDAQELEYALGFCDLYDRCLHNAPHFVHWLSEQEVRELQKECQIAIAAKAALTPPAPVTTRPPIIHLGLLGGIAPVNLEPPPHNITCIIS